MEITLLSLRSIFFTLLLPGSVTILIPSLLLNSGLEPTASHLGDFRFVGLGPIVIGIVILVRPIWDFARTGRGTLAPIDPPKTLVVRGWYRYVRNPMYVGVLLIVFGEAIFFESVRLTIYAGMLWLCFHLFVVLYEEPTLRRKFGDEYEAYRQVVGRWIPRVRQR